MPVTAQLVRSSDFVCVKPRIGGSLSALRGRIFSEFRADLADTFSIGMKNAMAAVAVAPKSVRWRSYWQRTRYACNSSSDEAKVADGIAAGSIIFSALIVSINSSASARVRTVPAK